MPWINQANEFWSLIGSRLPNNDFDIRDKEVTALDSIKLADVLHFFETVVLKQETMSRSKLAIEIFSQGEHVRAPEGLAAATVIINNSTSDAWKSARERYSAKLG